MHMSKIFYLISHSFTSLNIYHNSCYTLYSKYKLKIFIHQNIQLPGSIPSPDAKSAVSRGVEYLLIRKDDSRPELYPLICIPPSEGEPASTMFLCQTFLHGRNPVVYTHIMKSPAHCSCCHFQMKGVPNFHRILERVFFRLSLDLPVFVSGCQTWPRSSP